MAKSKFKVGDKVKALTAPGHGFGVIKQQVKDGWLVEFGMGPSRCCCHTGNFEVFCHESVLELVEAITKYKGDRK